MGALDGKHLLVKASVNCGYYFNYKNNFSIVLLALVEADCRFLYVVVGRNGRVSDGGVFRDSTISRALATIDQTLKDPKPMPGDFNPIPYLIVADDGFPLKPYLLKPYYEIPCHNNIIYFVL